MSKILLAPVYNDPHNALELITQVVSFYPQLFEEIILVDDGSDSSLYDYFSAKNDQFCNQEITIIRLSSNLGHQRAIAIGLCFVTDNYFSSDVVVLDSDGEDGIPQIQFMLDVFDEDSNVVATRSKRQEGFLFRQGYWCFKHLFYLMTGNQLNFGNFSLINHRTVNFLVKNPSLWNNYPATLLRFIPKLTRVRLPRQKRFSGKSSMNLVSFIQHGLGAISVFLDKVLIRTILALFFIFLSLSFISIIGFGVFFNSFANFNLLYVGFAGLALLIVLNISLLVLFSLIIFLANRSTRQEPPIFYYKSFINYVKVLGKN
jgi:glycosyltransferase involved in cell wall biosynthesis